MSDDEHDNGEEGDFADWNEEEDEGQRRARCLFSSRTHPSPTAALAHAADAFGFDLRELTARYGLDFYGTIMALNYARTVAKDRGASGGTDDAESGVTAARVSRGAATSAFEMMELASSSNVTKRTRSMAVGRVLEISLTPRACFLDSCVAHAQGVTTLP